MKKSPSIACITLARIGVNGLVWTQYRLSRGWEKTVRLEVLEERQAKSWCGEWN